jgi:hypothetical protein
VRARWSSDAGLVDIRRLFAKDVPATVSSTEREPPPVGFPAARDFSESGSQRQKADIRIRVGAKDQNSAPRQKRSFGASCPHGTTHAGRTAETIIEEANFGKGGTCADLSAPWRRSFCARRKVRRPPNS